MFPILSTVEQTGVKDRGEVLAPEVIQSYFQIQIQIHKSAILPLYRRNCAELDTNGNFKY